MVGKFGVVVAICLVAAIGIPCAGVFHKGEEASIASENAVIIYDRESQTQTFIRSALFSGKGTDFGFIVPTPSEPELSEVDGSVFREATQILARRTPRGAPKGSPPGGTGGFGGGNGVEIVKAQTVAGMKATILRAHETRSLQRWLSDNDYPATPEVMVWVEPYVEKQYFLTAFKIDRKSESVRVQTANVKMVFRTKMPFYPYREPRSSLPPVKNRSLGVYFFGPYIAKARYMNTNIPWEAARKPVSDLTIEEADRVMKAAKLEPEQIPVVPNMTYFFDRATVRRDFDVVFVPQD